ncbi:MAG: Serine-tRNA ligase [candidate division TM6 bacterium GW2011_GWF2_32_72]|nr:MAG: Serine-tRNA ligase [candidate division TM6 bacterium GW2011_GWF2_32_72]
MIDLNFLRENPKKVIELMQKKEPKFDIEGLIQKDVELRKLQQEVENLRAAKNDLAKQAKGGITTELREQSIQLGKDLKDKEVLFETCKQDFENLYLSCPNLIFDEIPVGNKESNKVVKEFGKKPVFNFAIKNHVELGEALGWLDFESAAKMTAGNFAMYRKDAVRLVYALTMYMLKNNVKYGFEPILPPYMVNEQSLINASNFPKFRDQVYSVPADGLFLSPTSEVNLTNIYKESILEGEALPIRMTAWTSCFRREAGGYGADERGLIRIHQFEKVELYTICAPENSEDEQQRMLKCAEGMLQELGLHYRVSLLAAQDCSFPSAKTYDIEVWMPGQNKFYEVSSISNCTDFQARRAGIRYREKVGEKTKLVHTLNGSSLALPRLIVALMETYQKADGSVEIPAILKKEGMWSK